jgi:hypothetical protein
VVALDVPPQWLSVTFVLLGGIWSFLLHHSWRFQLGNGLVQSVLGIEGLIEEI